MPHVKQENTDLTSTNSYATLLKAKICGRTDATVVISNSHTSNWIKYKVLVSNDEEGAANTWVEDKAEAVLNNSTSTIASHVLTGPFLWVDVQIKSNSDGVHGTGNAWLHAVGL